MRMTVLDRAERKSMVNRFGTCDIGYGDPRRERYIELNRIAAEHTKKYCDKKCPSGAPGMATWHDEDGVCWKCEFNPYNMEMQE